VLAALPFVPQSTSSPKLQWSMAPAASTVALPRLGRSSRRRWELRMSSSLMASVFVDAQRLVDAHEPQQQVLEAGEELREEARGAGVAAEEVDQGDVVRRRQPVALELGIAGT
jgi:hypothetical protein